MPTYSYASNFSMRRKAYVEGLSKSRRKRGNSIEKGCRDMLRNAEEENIRAAGREF